VFSIPFWRHFIAWLGGVPATPGNFKKVLKKGSVAVIVGGIAEMYMQVRGEADLSFEPRCAWTVVGQAAVSLRAFHKGGQPAAYSAYLFGVTSLPG
jgi:hypothetical protein